jgi:S-adenosylmethionine hydrolase
VPRTLTLTTDFGTQDAYVAAMKGVALQRCPGVPLVDVTHEVAPQDVMEAAFVLRQAVPYFPPGAVHLVVVDPGVGTERRPVALRAGERFFVGPDNGLFSLVLGEEEPDAIAVLDEPDRWRTPDPSTTFHGRDIFAPAAEHLAAGGALADLGSPAEELQPLRWALPITDDQGIQGWTVHVDRFGNCITNVPRTLFYEHADGRTAKCYAGGAILEGVSPTYGAVAEGEPLLVFGSSGFLEVAVSGGNAAKLLSIQKGDAVNVVFQSDDGA